MSELQDEQKRLKLALRGDTDALALLMHQHYPLLRNYTLKLTMNPALAEDIVQDTMLRCMEKLHLYNGKSRFSSWLITIATNLYMDMLRRNKVEQRWQEQAARAMKFQMGVDRHEWSEAMEQLGCLPPEQRAALLLKHYYGYTYMEIAEMLNCNEGTAKSRVHYAMNQMRKELSRDD